MKANELRIGNYYNYNGEILRVEPSVIEDLCDSEENNWCKPIPLTKEWLLKFGFEQYGQKNEANPMVLNSRIFYTVIEDNQFEIAYDFGIVKKLLLRFREGDLSVIYKMDIKYIHQLQNLYFELTGKELIIKQ
jgi:hypothetical protein